MRSVTKQAIREARLKEIKDELLHSEKLKVRWGEDREGKEYGLRVVLRFPTIAGLHTGLAGPKGRH